MILFPVTLVFALFTAQDHILLTHFCNLAGVPVATVGINNSVNAALLAARILGSFDPTVQRKVEVYAESAKNENLNLKGTKMRELGWEKYFEQMQK